MHNKSSEIKQALRAQFRKGTSKLAKRVCFGYNQNEHGDLVINPTEAEIVKWMFERYLSGASLGKIADELYRKGDSVSDRQGKMEPGGDRQIAFQRKIYRRCPLQKTISVMGVQIENTGSADRYLTKNTHSAIISVELFKAVQEEKGRRCRGNMQENAASEMLYVIGMM